MTYKYYAEDYTDVSREEIRTDGFEITGSGGGCFPAGTLVRTASGMKPIQFCMSGEMIVAYDRFGEVEHGYVIEQKIHRHSEYEDDLYFIYTGEVSLFPEGITGNHAVYDYLTKEHKEIKDFKVGDNLVDLDGNLIEITNIHITTHDSLPEDCTVYNLIVEPQHTYMVGKDNLFIRVHNGGGGKSASASAASTEDPNTLQSTTYARVLEVVSHGVIEEIVGGAKGVYLNGTAIQNTDNTYNFSNVSFAYRGGAASQSVIPGFEVTEVEDSTIPNGGIAVTTILPASHTILGTNVDAIRVTLRFPNGLSLYYKQLGALKGYSCSFNIYTKATIGSSWNLRFTGNPTGKTTSPWEVDVRINALAGEHLYAVRVDRITGDDSSWVNQPVVPQSMFNLQRVTAIYNGAISYNKIAVAGIKLDAKTVGYQIPTRGYMVKGIKCKVPSNYNPVTRAYTGGYWNGVSFQTLWTDNPAWVLYDLITNTEYGIANYLGLSISVDAVEFFNASLYNDCVTWTGSAYSTSLIPDGSGGYEVRYKMNVVIATQQDAWQLLQAVASCMRAVVVCNGAKISLVQDKPRLPVRMFTNSNVIDGVFNYSSSEATTRATSINCTFNDANDRYLPRTITEPTAATIAQGWYNNADTKYGYNVKDIVAYGCTTESQARRMAKWALYTEIAQPSAVSFSTSLNIAGVAPGEIVSVMDDMDVRQDNKFLTGRLVSISGNVATFSNTVTLTAGHTFKFSVMKLDYSSMLEYTITSSTGDVTSVTLSSAPPAGDYTNRDFFCYSTGFIEPRQYLVNKIVEGDKGIYTVIGSLYDVQKYAAIENGLSIIPRSYGPPVPLYLPKVSNIQFFERYSNDGIAKNNSIEVRWEWDENHQIKGGVTYILRWKRDDGEYTSINGIITKDFHIPGTVPGVYAVIIEVESFQGKRSLPTYATYNYRTNSGTSTLEPPTEFYVANTAGTAFVGTHIPLTWKYQAANDNKTDTLLDYVLEVWTSNGTNKLNSFVIQPDPVKFTDSAGLVPNPFYKGGKFNYTYEQNKNDYGSPNRNVQLRLYSRDLIGDLSIASAKNFTNSVPALVNWTVNAAFNSVYVNITPSTEEDIKEYIVYAGLTAGYTPTNNDIVYAGLSPYVNIAAGAGDTYYYKLSVVDTFGRTGSLISTAIGVAAVGADPDMYTYDGLDFKPNNPTTNKVSWTAFTVTKTTTSGTETSWNVIAGNALWSTGVLYMYYLPGNTTLSSTTSLLGAITAGGRVVATYQGGTKLYTENGRAFTSGDMLLAGTVGASQLVTNTAVITNAAQIGNVIESSTYHWNDGAVPPYAGWRLDKNGWLQVTGITVRASDGTLLMSSGGVEYTSAGGSGSVPNTIAATNFKLDNIDDGATKNTIYRTGGAVPNGSFGDIWYVTSATAGYETGATYTYSTNWEKLADITVTQLAGTGVNIVNPRYATFEESSLPPLGGAGEFLASLDATTGFLGSKCLRIAAPTAAVQLVYLSSAAADYNFTITPNKKWIVSFYVKASIANAACHIRFRIKNKDTLATTGANVSGITSPTIGTWVRISGVVDWSTNASTLGQIEVNNDTFGATPADMWFDGFMIESQIGDKTTPSPYHEPPNFLTTFIGALDANRNHIYRQPTAPTGGVYTTEDLWFQETAVFNGVTVPTLYQWDGTGWAIVSKNITNTQQIQDTAGLGTKADWLQVTNRPTSLATLDSTYAAIIDDMSSDSKFSPIEKRAVLKEWVALIDERALLITQANAYSVTTEKTAYTDATRDLRNYLNADSTVPATVWSNTIPLWLSTDATNGKSKTTNIVGSTFRNFFNTYYTARTTLLNKIADITATKAIWDSITGITKPADNATNNHTYIQPTAPDANSVPIPLDGYYWIDTAAVSPTHGGNKLFIYEGLNSTWVLYRDVEITDAAINAANAINAVNDIALDNKLSPIEKSALRKEWDSLVSEKSIIESQANTYTQVGTPSYNATVVTSKATYLSALNSLGTYLNNSSAWIYGNATPLWINDANLATTTTLPGGGTAGSTFRSTFLTYYNARVSIIKDITNAADTNSLAIKTIADAAKAVTDDIVSDLRFSPTEKKVKRIEWEQIASERSTLEAQATLLNITGIELTNYQDRWNLLAQNLNDGVVWAPTVVGVWTAPIPTRIDDTGITTTTPFNTTTRDIFRTRYNNFYNARITLTNKIANAAVWTSIISKPTSFLNTDETNQLAAATTNANNAIAATNAMSSDGIFSPNEKIRVLAEWEVIVGERALLRTQATAYGITTEKTNYETTSTALRNYLNGDTTLPPPPWNNTTPLWISNDFSSGITSNTTITGSVFRQKFTDYYNAKIALLGKFPDIAVLTADAAITATSEMASDAKFTPVEKKRVATEWQSIVGTTGDRQVLIAQAAVYGVSSTAFATAVNDLRRYLNNTPTTGAWTDTFPLWINANIAITTDLADPATFRTKFANYYIERTTLIKAITDQASTSASQTALWSGISGIPYETIFNNDDSVVLGFNPTFANWTGTYPANWINNGGAAPSKETTIVRPGMPYAVRFAATGVDQGIRNTVTITLPVGTFLSGSIDMYLAAVTAGLPGVIIRLYTNAELTTSVLTRVQPASSTTGVWVRVPFSARVGATQQIFGIRVAVMASDAAFASGAFTGTVIFGNLRFALFDSSTDNTTIKLTQSGTTYSLNGGGSGDSVSITGLGYTGALNATYGAPGGTPVGSVTADAVATATTDFNASNNRNNTAIVNPTIDGTGLSIDHTINTDGSCNISFEWAWTGANGDIDGWIVWSVARTSAAAYTIVGGGGTLERANIVAANKRAFVIYGAPSNLYYTFAVQAYRKIDKGVDTSAPTSNLKKSAIVQGGFSEENPYLPSANVAFAGDITGTVFGNTSSQVVTASNGITSGNASTFIADAAISRAKIGALNVGTADIVNAAITRAQILNGEIVTAKIADLAVNTLKIGNNAVTIPTGSSGYGPNATPHVTLDALGAPVIALGTMNVNNTSASGMQVQLLMDGAIVQAMGVAAGSYTNVALMMKLNPATGSHTYTVTSSLPAMHLDCSIVVLGVKK